MKKKSIFVIPLLTFFALTACGGNTVPKDNTDNGDPNSQQGGDNNQGSGGDPSGGGSSSGDPAINAILQAYKNMATLDNLTMNLSVKSTYETDSGYFAYKNVPMKEISEWSVKTELQGNNSRVVTKSQQTETLKLSDFEKALGYNQYETIDYLKQYSLMYLMNGYGFDLDIDTSHDLVTKKGGVIQSEVYVIYDESINQLYSYEIGDDKAYYLAAMPNFTQQIDQVMDLLADGTMKDGKLVIEIQGVEYSAEFNISNNIVSRMVLTSVGLESIVEYSKIGETVVTIPAEHPVPQCVWAHDEHTDYEYMETPTGHRRACFECGRFLDEEETPHVTSHNDMGVCEVCGHCEGEEDVTYEVPEGFEKGTGQYYLYIKKTAKGALVGEPYINYESNLHSYWSNGLVTKQNYLFTQDHVIFAVSYSQKQKITGTCLDKTDFEFKLYRNIPDSFLQELQTAEDPITTLREYVDTLTNPSATYSGSLFNISHSSRTLETITVDSCHTIDTYTCTDCHQLVQADYHTNHASSLVETTQVIDECHTLVNEDCPSCHEHHEEIRVDHVEGNPRDVKTTIDTCHKLVEHHCATCDDVIGYDIETNHGTNVEDIDVAVDSCTTITYTICHDCEMIADKETNSDHQHVTQVCCIGHEVEDYDIDIYVFENAIYMFDYCTDCGKVVGGVSQIRPYDTIEHAFVPTGVEVFTLSEYGGYYSYNYVQKKYDHIYDESGHCIFCNAMHYDMGDEPIEFYVRYYYGYPECYFVIKDTKQILYLNDFDNNPENVYLEEGYKEIYESSDYPGIQLIKYYDNNYENVKIEILYNNLGTSQIILPSNFDN